MKRIDIVTLNRYVLKSLDNFFFNVKGSKTKVLENICKIFLFQSVGKGWFNMKGTSNTKFDFGKLKRFLTVVRLVM
jgi:dynein heavy chain